MIIIFTRDVYMDCIYPVSNSCMYSALYVGICYGFEVMRFAESPDIPFTVTYERFPTGK